MASAQPNWPSVTASSGSCQAHGVSEVQAVLYQTLVAAPNPSAETQWLLGQIHGTPRADLAPTEEVRQWLASVAQQLLGVSV